MPGTTTLGLPTYTTADSAEPLDAILTDISDAADAAIQARTPMSRILRVRRAAAQSISNVTETSISFDTQDEDPAGMFAPTSDSITVQTGGGGLWIVTAQVKFDAITSGVAYAALSVNGTTQMVGPVLPQVGASFARIVAVSQMLRLVATDVVRLRCYHNSGSAINANEAYLHMAWLAV